MVLKQQKKRINRYKKNGRGGGIVLAVITVLLFFIASGAAYVIYRYKHEATEELKHKTLIQQRLSTPLLISAQSRFSSPQSKIPEKNIVEPVPLSKQEPYYTGEPHSDNIPTKVIIPQKSPSSIAMLAIVVDDMGSSVQEANLLVSIGVPVSFAVIPGLRHDREVSAIAINKGFDVLIHIPMQSKEYPKRKLESNGLLLEYSDSEIRNRILGYFDSVPGAVGANNHMGSGFTENIDKMRAVLGVLKERGLFFLDSITTPQTTGLQVASELKIRNARRDVFLDNEQNEAYIRGQLAQAISKARKNGHAIAICHPHPKTIATLTKILPGLKGQGIKLVPVSHLVK